MILDERTYTIMPRKMPLYLAEHFEHALPLMRRYLGEPYGYFTSETGTLNQFVHLWRYDSMTDRENRRDALYRNAEWLDYHAKMADTGWVQLQESRLLRSFDIPPGSK